MNACIDCSEPIVQPALTGVLCQGCFEREQAPPALKWGPVALGLFAVATPFALVITYNGVDYVKLVGGAVGILAGIWLAHSAVKASDEKRAKVFFTTLAVLAGAAFHLWTAIS